ncbi:alcohol dehydrogenase catalytic domain-containing protein [Streptomyces sp. AC512_CC834]|uniref:alcohol dehydrogenase catalytic domain-containing protein n=1 Tax=Streptomyces sp. AC512_CC834 TaxID=2823691 RepID=UPI0020B84E79|nr:alcohol dehydrogenase catalytic domain-containing protein [Streptomyces sp. AC512_CC834]
MAEVPAPEITGPYDVIVRIGGAGVCRTDIHILQGQWAQKSGVALPYTIGHENAGWVHVVGSAITVLADAGLTAYHAAARAARRLRPGDRCVVIGAGGLGHIGMQVLKALTAAESVVVDRNPDAVTLALSVGADHGVLADGEQVDRVRELSGGHGAEAVVDFVGEGGSTNRRDQLHRQPRRLLQ